jgi:preprotein translocase subunit SecG
MFTTLIVFQVLVAIGLIAIVLVQRGPGATMGAAFGAGASGTVFGSRGAGNFLTRTTSWLALGFFGISLSLAVLATGFSGGSDPDSALSGSVVEQEAAEAEDEAGAAIDSALESLDQQAEAIGADEADAGAADSPPSTAADDDGSAASDADSGDEIPEPPPGA